MLRETSCPAVLIEVGFLSNPADIRKLLDADWQEACAAAIAQGIFSYSRKVDALDKAVADKRAREMEANERWRHRIAAQAAQKAAALAATSQPAAATNAAAKSDSASSVTTVSSSSSTNRPALEIDTLIEFYAPGNSD